MATPNIEAPHLATATEPSVPINQALDDLDTSVNTVLEKSFAAGDVALTDDEHNQSGAILCTGAGADRVLTLRARPRRIGVINAGGFAVTVTTAAPSSPPVTVAVAAGTAVLVQTDGVDVYGYG